MSFNLVDLVKDQISDQLLGQMGGIMGTDGSQTTGALSGALPGLLSGLMNSASSPAGAGALFDVAQKQDDNLLGNIGNLLGGDQSSSIASKGTSMLGTLLGNGALGQLAGVIANFSGVSRGSSSSLLGVLAPIVIGVIKRKIFDGGLNAGSLANLMSDQKANINASMPQGFSDQLQSAGFFDSISPEPLAAAAPQPAAAQAEAPKSGGFMKWLLPLAAVLAVVYFGKQLLTKDTVTDAASNAAATVQEGASQASDAAAAAVQSAQEAMPEGVDLSKITDGLQGVFGSTTEALSGVTDVESAKAALPALESATGTLSGLSDVITRLPDAAKGPIGSVVTNGINSLQPLIDKISALPGVGPLIEPIVTPMLETLNGLTG